MLGAFREISGITEMSHLQISDTWKQEIIDSVTASTRPCWPQELRVTWPPSALGLALAVAAACSQAPIPVS